MQVPIHLLNKTIVPATSVGTTFSSSPVEVNEAIRLCIQASWTGSSPVGSIQVEGSNDGTIWSADPEATAITVTGNTGQAIKKIVNCSYSWVRVTYTATSGTGTVTVTLNAKRA